MEDARSGLVYASTVAGTDGTWSLESLDLPVGDTAVTVRTTAPDGTETLSASETVRLRAPSVLAPSTASASSGVPVLVLSDPGAVQLLVDGEVALERTVSSAGFVATLDLAAGEHEIGVRYASADGRVRGGRVDRRRRALRASSAADILSGCSPTPPRPPPLRPRPWAPPRTPHPVGTSPPTTGR